MNMGARRGWWREFECWLQPFLAVLGHTARRRWAPVYLRGLIGPGERKSIQPLAARVTLVSTSKCTTSWPPPAGRRSRSSGCLLNARSSWLAAPAQC